MTLVDERIAALETKLKQAKERKRKADVRARTAASKRERTRDTRRKILVGATVLARADKDQAARDRLATMLDAALTRDDDRALFELPLLGDAEQARRTTGNGEASASDTATRDAP